MAIILKASSVINQRLPELQARCDSLKSKGIIPTMKVILVGEHPPSLIYTRNKKKFCEKFGAACDIINFPADVKVEDFVARTKEIASNPAVHGCFIQLPLPKHLQHLPLHEFIPAHKDVDGLCPENIFLVAQGNPRQQGLIPCTPKGIITMLQHYGLEISGKRAVVVGRSMIVGKPMSYLLTNLDATVTLAHSRTADLRQVTRSADIVIAAVGKAKFMDASYFDASKAPVIVDVGMNHDENGALCGDVHFDQVQALASAITPVPGGVGPMTIFSLAENLLTAAERAKR